MSHVAPQPLLSLPLKVTLIVLLGKLCCVVVRQMSVKMVRKIWAESGTLFILTF